MKASELFLSMHPGFFQNPQIQSIPNGEIYSEMILPLKSSNSELPISVPDSVTFRMFSGDNNILKSAVNLVIPEWVPIYQDNTGTPVLCGYESEQLVSFCMLDDMGTYAGLHIGGPGCVGTVPEARGKRIGLRMVQIATEYFRKRSFDLSYIHYTGVDHWYAHLGYKTILQWNRKGIITDSELGLTL